MKLQSAISVIAVTALLSACAPAPIYKPIKAGDVDTGPGTLEAVRRQLEGTWALTSYEIYQNGKRQRLAADAQLKYDEFSNLTMSGQLRNPSASNAKPLLLNYSGRSVIDVTSHELRLLDIESTGGRLQEAVAAAAGPENVRKYSIQGDVLTLTILAADGTPTAASAWKKQP
jgi:hypothetical protein